MSAATASPRNSKPFQPRRAGPAAPGSSKEQRPPDPVLFQQWFKSVNPLRTYAAQLKRAGNGNQYVVFTEGKRNKETNELKKIGLYLYSEDFAEFFKMVDAMSSWLKAHPMSAQLQQKRSRFWAKQANGAPPAGRAPNATSIGPKPPLAPTAKTTAATARVLPSAARTLAPAQGRAGE